MTKRDRLHLERFNALLDGGWLGRLTKIESAVYLAMLKHMNAQCVASVEPRTLASYICHASNSHIREARRALVEFGLLTVINKGGGREIATYRLNVPPARRPDASQE